MIIIISAVLYSIYKKKAFVLGESISISPILKSNVISKRTNTLKYFYEYKPGIKNITLDWENTNGPKNPTYKINPDRLNQTTSFNVDKPKDVIRIVALGDSFTFGENVNTEDNYPSQLQGLLDKECKNKFEILNLGVGGYDIQYTVEKYKLRGLKYDPDLILWFVIDADMLRMNEIMMPILEFKRKEMKASGEDKAEIKRGNMYAAAKKSAEDVRNKFGEEYILNLQKKYFKEIYQVFNKKLLIFTFPFAIDKYASLLKEVSVSNHNGLFYNQIPNIYTIDGAALPDRHPSPLGHKLIAQNLFEYLTKNKLIPCNN